MKAPVIILISATTSALVTGTLFVLINPRLLKKIEKRLLITMASVLSEALMVMAREAESVAQSRTTTTTTTWPVSPAALRNIQ